MPAADHIAPSIRYLRRNQVDTARWDSGIDSSLTPLIYGKSFYLDHMAAGSWDALVLGDYEAFMPLPWRSKAGIRYLYQPAFTQQTGIFAARPVTPSVAAAFLEEAARHYRFAEIFLNYGNAHASLGPRVNYILPLDTPYGEISAHYKKDLVRNLKIAAGANLHYTKDFDLPTALRLFRREYAQRLPSVKKGDYRRFESLCLYLQQRQQVLVRAATDEKGRPLCTAVLLRDNTRFYLLQSTNPPEGRAAAANHFLLDRFIREWAGASMTIDFEGSDHPGIAHFYANFGAIDQPYFFHRHNRLPWPLRLLK